MSYDIEGVYKQSTNKGEKIFDLTLAAGAVALSIFATPIVVFSGLRKRASQIISESLSAVGELRGESYDGSFSPMNYRHNSTQIVLPNQLLSEVVEVTRVENPLLSEAPKIK